MKGEWQGDVRTEGWAEDNKRKEEEQRGKENKVQRGGRKEMRGEREEVRSMPLMYHLSALPASQFPVLAACIVTDRPYGFIMRQTQTQTHTMHEDTPASTNT